MKDEKLLDAFGQIDEEFVEEADPEKRKTAKKKSKKSLWIKWGAMAACAVVIVGVGIPHYNKYGGNPEEPMLEGNIADITSGGKVQNEAGEAENETMAYMTEIKIKIDEIFPDGFRGTIEVGTDLFKEGEQITVVAQDNITVVQKDGSIFDYNELEPNIKESDLAVGNSVWVGFQTFDYVVGSGKYNKIFAYHVGGNSDDTVTNYGENIPNSASGIVINELEEPINMMLPNLREEIRTPMTNEELYKYYDTNFANALKKVVIFEELESPILKGIYTYADGGIFDMNQFIYYQAEMNYELCISIGRNTRCSKLVSNMDENAQSCKINEIDVVVFKTENEGDVVYYATFELGECDYIISAINMDEEVFEKILGSITR